MDTYRKSSKTTIMSPSHQLQTTKTTNIRLATPRDIPRMGTVTISGCHPSQSFAYNQPYYSSHPLSALRSSRQSYKQMMMSSLDKILLVIEDTYNPDEDAYCPGLTTREENEDQPNIGDTVVVGVAVYTLPTSSKRLGHYQNTKAIETTFPVDIDGTDKSTDFWHTMTYFQKTASVINSHFSNSLYLNTLTVHPAYSRRGHGADLTRWGIELAKIDGVDLGLVASEFGNKLYKRLGFGYVEDFTVKCDEISPRGVEGEVLRWRFDEGFENGENNRGEERRCCCVEKLIDEMMRLKL